MEHLPTSSEGPAQSVEKSPKDIKLEASKLFIMLGEKGLLNLWGDSIGEPNPDMKAFNPIRRRRTRKERSEERQSEPPPALDKIDPDTVVGEIKRQITAWKLEHPAFGKEQSIRVWEEMTNHLLARGRTRLHDAVLQALYNLES